MARSKPVLFKLIWLSCLVSSTLPVWAYSHGEALPNVPLTELMVQVPPADFEQEMDALAQTYQQAPTPKPKPKPAAGPSQLDFSEVFLSQAQWLSDINQQADKALARQQWPIAEGLLVQALAEYPDAHDTRLRLASMLYGRGALDQARAVIQEGLEYAPQQPELRLSLARILAEQQRYGAALSLLEQATPPLASHLDYYSLQADMARRSDRCAQAITTYRQLLAEHSRGNWWLGLGLCQREQGEDYRPAFIKAQASADLGVASQQYIAQQLEQHETTQTH